MLSDTTFENGTWLVVDHQLGRPIVDRDGSAGRTRLEAQALADFRNGVSASPPMRCVDELRINPGARLRTPDAAFDEIPHAELRGDSAYKTTHISKLSDKSRAAQ